MRENLTYGLTRVQGKQALIYVLRPCPTLQFISFPSSAWEGYKAHVFMSLIPDCRDF